MKNYIKVCKDKLGMVPNVILANASDPERLKTFVNFYNRLMLKEGYLSKLEREMIAVVVSSCNKCFYCLIAHGAVVRQLSKNPILGDELIINAIAETNFLEEDTLIVITLTEDTRYFNHVTFSSTIVESGKNEIAVGDEVVAKGKGNVKGKQKFEAETLTIIVR
jgi:uncharacterized peroxidase-related enzyme